MLVFLKNCDDLSILSSLKFDSDNCTACKDLVDNGFTIKYNYATIFTSEHSEVKGLSNGDIVKVTDRINDVLLVEKDNRNILIKSKHLLPLYERMENIMPAISGIDQVSQLLGGDVTILTDGVKLVEVHIKLYGIDCKGKALTHDNDVFSLEKGITLAVLRALGDGILQLESIVKEM